MPTSQNDPANPANGTPPRPPPKLLDGAEPIRTAVKVRPHTVAAPTGEIIGYPLRAQQALAAMRIDSPNAKRHTVRCVADDHYPISHVSLPLPLPLRWSVLAGRHRRLGAGCVPGLRMLPEEIWERIFHFAVTKLDVPNAIEFGDPPRPVDSPRGRFHCGLALNALVSQPTMYETLMVPLVESALEGYSSALVTFGPRGSGKSHTLEGPPRGVSASGDSGAGGADGSCGACSPEGAGESGEGGEIATGAAGGARAADEGLMRKALRHTLLALHRRHGAKWGAQNEWARFACFAVHKRIVYDMLAPDAPMPRKIVRTDAAGGRCHAYVDRLHAPPVANLADCDALLDAARAARYRLPVCPSCANWTRELDLFWTLHIREGPLGGGSLSFVKLAGLDRRQRCNECRPLPTTNPHGRADGHQTVSSLSVVLSALADGKTTYVPYRDSPTTELMQEMLCGRAKVAWLAHVVPGPEGDFDETVATLQATVRVGKILNTPQRLPHGLQVAERAAEAREIEELQGLLKARSRLSSRPAPGTPSGPSLAQRAVEGVRPSTPPEVT